ncbi:rod shape-determining protein MreC [Thioclava sp. GXIMD4216]|uniref:Cell shape-determining protein MreC n=1 Tax=Thioclava litoralis TaxID=3076557 RepID=A0ABZ1DZR6_9RHOB|nr:rod shape-determining protein MreC [Thioclava sp. FTW29]
MARHRDEEDYLGPLRRIVIAILALALVATVILWRVDNPRVERLRSAFIDRYVPTFDWAMVPVTKFLDMVEGFQSYARLYDQNQELRRELQQMKAWKEAAVQLRQENDKLLAQNNVRLDPKLTSVSGVVLADSGSPFRQSVLLNIGSRDGIVDGWATMDGLGLVGRISGVGKTTSRVVLLTDSSSRIPVTLQPSGQRAIMSGDNSPFPPLDFLEHPDRIQAGDRVVSSGDGGVFPAGLLVGQVVERNGRLRVRLSADYERLEYLKVLRSHPAEQLKGVGALIPPPIGKIDSEQQALPPAPQAQNGQSNG